MSTEREIEEAKKMVAHFMGLDNGEYFYEGGFTPTTYQSMRWDWEGEATPAWATLKKYAAEAGLISEDVACAWHSDGSALAEMCGIAEGTVFHFTVYHF